MGWLRALVDDLEITTDTRAMPFLQLADIEAEERWRRARDIPDVLWDRNSARIARLREIIATASGAAQMSVPPLSLTELEDELEWRRGHSPTAAQWTDNYRRTGELNELIAGMRAGRQPASEQRTSGEDRSTLAMLFAIFAIFAAAWLFLNL